MSVLGWLVCACDDVPGGDAWLSPHERARLAGMRFAKRRDDFRVGRWTAKRAIRAMNVNGPDPCDVDIRAAEDGAPEVFFPGGPAPWSVSIAHAGGRGLAVVGPPGVPFGADLETIAPRSAAFLEDYFLDSERRWIAGHPDASRDGAATLLWSVKEAVLKALRTGLREDTRAVEVLPGGAAFTLRTSPGWMSVGAFVKSQGRVFEGFAMEREGQWLTIVAEGTAPTLIALAP